MSEKKWWQRVRNSMRLPWGNTKPTITPAPEPEPEPEVWVVKKGDWCEREVCHCGQIHTYDVCPKCGHKDKWEKFVGRETWEECPVIQKRLEKNFTSGSKWGDWHRNETFERWTPEHCEVKDVG